jgi:hypothetical protein
MAFILNKWIQAVTVLICIQEGHGSILCLDTDFHDGGILSALSLLADIRIVLQIKPFTITALCGDT